MHVLADPSGAWGIPWVFTMLQGHEWGGRCGYSVHSSESKTLMLYVDFRQTCPNFGNFFACCMFYTFVFNLKGVYVSCCQLIDI